MIFIAFHQIKTSSSWEGGWANPIFFRGLTKVTPTFQGSETKNDPLETQAYGRDCQFRIIPSLILSGSWTRKHHCRQFRIAGWRVVHYRQFVEIQDIKGCELMRRASSALLRCTWWNHPWRLEQLSLGENCCGLFIPNWSSEYCLIDASRYENSSGLCLNQHCGSYC
jgi:hypothetical protein